MTIFQILLIISIIFMGNFFERLERESPNLFWGLTIVLATAFTSIDENSLIHNPSPTYTEQILLKTRGGSDSGQAIVTIRTSLGKRKKINIITHRRLEKFFPDWEERMAYQENREKVYKSAMIKRQKALSLRQKEDFARTKDEQDAIDYFLGRGFYRTHQDPSAKPNIFDNRQSFLIKMHTQEMRMNFLKSFNRRYTLIP
jgi:hypothetical protein